MPLGAEEIAALARELAGLAGCRVEKVHQRDPHALVLTLGRRREESAPGRRWQRLFLLLSVRAPLARVHLVGERGEVPGHPPPFGAWLRERLTGARIIGVREPGRARAVEIDLLSREPIRPAAAGRGEVGERRQRRWILVAELAGSSPNLVLLDGGRRLQGSLFPVRRGGTGTGTGTGTEDLKAGEAYQPPPVPSPPSALSALTSSPWRYLPVEETEGSPGDQEPSRLFPLNFALGRYYQQVEAEVLLRERRQDLARRLAGLLAKRRKLISRLEGDLAAAREGEGGLRFGELLKAEIPRLRRGMDRVEVVDYYAADLPRVVIPLDPARDPLQNIERYFRRYRKAQRAVPVILERVERVRLEISRLEDLSGSLEKANSPSDFREIEKRFQGLSPAPVPSASRQPRTASPVSVSGPRRFTSRDGLTILVGRGGAENDELTFRLARGNDVFLHVSGRPGPHVVIRTLPGRPVPPETLFDAAQLALYYSLTSRHATRFEEGFAADVDYVEVKHVRKPRGARPGAVLLARHQTLRVNASPERIQRLRQAKVES
jgi:predicted ribosome quality control (RQC) complex YloA/Tae2 family protein